MKSYTSDYRNEFGELWVFEYNYSDGVGVVRGSDVDWMNYPVIEGQTLDLVLDEGEKSWLLTSWETATGDLTNKNIYGAVDVVFMQDGSGCWLSNNYCPLCLKQKRNFEYHHCIWSADGGTNEYFNMLRVCSTCHAILTRGSDEDRIPKDLADFYHQLMYFGMSFFPRSSPKTGRHQDRNFLDLHPELKKMIVEYDRLENIDKKQIDDLQKVQARLRYQYFRDMGLGKWSWDEFYQQQMKIEQQIRAFENGVKQAPA